MLDGLLYGCGDAVIKARAEGSVDTALDRNGKSRAHRQGLADLIDYIRHDDTVRIASMNSPVSATRSLSR